MWRRSCACALLLAAVLLCAERSAGAGQSRMPAADEVRALWVQRSTLTSAASVTRLIDAAKAAGFNTLLVQARGRGDAYYVSPLEPRGSALRRQNPSFDPLALAIVAGHHAGLRVHAWINVNLVSDAEPPADRTHIAHAHPDWLMVPRELAEDMARLNPRDPAYLAALTRYARAHGDRIEGLYASPIQPAAAEHTVAVIADIAARYAVDGIHLDYARYPNDEFDYSRDALAQFRADVTARVSADERREYDARAEGRPLFYTQMFPQRWQEFRRERLTRLVTRVRAAVKAARPDAVLSAAVWPDPVEASSRRLQDWGGWLDSALLDVVCPMAYTVDAAQFRSQIAGVTRSAGSQPVWAGIGAYRLPASDAVQNIRAARQLGARGVILFSYDNLDREYLSAVNRGAFGR